MPTIPKSKTPSRPPHSLYLIEDMLERKDFDGAQLACDENVTWCDVKADEYRTLFRCAEILRRGSIPVTSEPYEFTPVLDPIEQANR